MNKIKGGDRMVFRESETVELKEAVTDEIKKKSLLLPTVTAAGCISAFRMTVQ